MLTPSAASTATTRLLLPTFRASAPEALPLATVVPLTVSVEVELVAVGVSVTDVMEFATVTE